jgi:D-inositol-3-phosphate glycosyltransferase
VKVYLKAPGGLSHAMTRVENALRKHLPSGVMEVTRREDADLEVLHVVGTDGLRAHLSSMSARQFAVIQYCVRSTLWMPSFWLTDVWSKATCVWSYYDLNQLLADDNDDRRIPSFYLAPLGVDQTFRRWHDKNRYLAACTGYVAESECLHEVAHAALATSIDGKWGSVFHLGPDEVFPQSEFPNVKSQLNISDDVLAQQYSRSRFVTGLRRVEGFELPLAEGLLCGAMPITFDSPHYRKWFDGLAHFIPEDHNVALSLQELFSAPYVPPSHEQMNECRNRFNWHTIAPNFWQRALCVPLIPEPSLPEITHTSSASTTVTMSTSKGRKKVLWVGDAVVASGFAKATHGICDVLAKTHDVRVLGLHHDGDPHEYSYPVHTTWFLQGGDVLGAKKLPMLIDEWHPDVVIIQADAWQFPAYLSDLHRKWTDDPKLHRPVVIGAVAIDGKNARGRGLRHLDHAVFWTKFGQDEAVKGGYEGPSDVIPLGVDLHMFYPEAKLHARRFMTLPEELHDKFIVGYVGRNQPRKRLDLLVRYFANWVNNYDAPDAMLYIHYAPTGEDAWDIKQLGDYYKVNGRIISVRPSLGFGASEKTMRMTYNCFNVFASCTQGEGWGLPHLEAAACRIPLIQPNWSALGEIFAGAAWNVDCTSVYHTPNKANCVGGVPDEEGFIRALNYMYQDRAMVEDHGLRALKVAQRPEYRWSDIGARWSTVIASAIHRPVLDEVLISA